MLPTEKFTSSDLAYLRHVYRQYIDIDTESTVASLTPEYIENFRRAARERRPISYDIIETFQAIPERSSHKVGWFGVFELEQEHINSPIFPQFLKGALNLDISSEDLSTLLENNNPILNSWIWSLTNSPQNPFLEEYFEQFRVVQLNFTQEIGVRTKHFLVIDLLSLLLHKLYTPTK